MGIIKFDAVDDMLKWATLASAIQNTPGGAWTVLVGVRHNAIGSWQGYLYLLSGTGAGVAQAGFGMNSGNDILHDVPGFQPLYNNIDATQNADILYIASKASGLVAPNGSRKVGSAGAWTHQVGDVTVGNQIAAAQFQLGAWQAQDFINGWEAVAAIWNVELSQAQREACGANWCTSDIYNAHPTPPLILLELNVVAASIVNLGSAAISGDAHVGTTLDAAQTFGGWDFDGLGVASQKIRPDGDIDATGWSTAPLWSKIDEDTPGGDTITGVAS